MSLLSRFGLKLPRSEGYEKVRIETEQDLTTQKVSHPPVSPKYWPFPPSRRLLNIAMA